MNVTQMDRIADMAKEFHIRVSSGDKAVNATLKKIGIPEENRIVISMFSNSLYNLQEIENEKERDSIGMALFGTNWEDL